MHLLPYSQHKLTIFLLALYKEHDINTISSIPLNVHKHLITVGCRPALGGSNIATNLYPLPVILLSISSIQSSILLSYMIYLSFGKLLIDKFSYITPHAYLLHSIKYT